MFVEQISKREEGGVCQHSTEALSLVPQALHVVGEGHIGTSQVLRALIWILISLI